MLKGGGGFIEVAIGYVTNAFEHHFPIILLKTSALGLARTIPQGGKEFKYLLDFKHISVESEDILLVRLTPLYAWLLVSQNLLVTSIQHGICISGCEVSLA